jgi:hypothetical protein
VTRQVAAIVLAASVLGAVAGCTGDSTPSTQPSHPSPGSPATATAPSAAEARLAAVYVAAVRALLRIDPAVASPTYISTRVSGSHDPVPAAVQGVVTGRLGPRYDVHWITGKGDVMPSSGSYLALPPVPTGDDRFLLRLSTLCGNVCGTFATFLLTRHAGRWSARRVGGVGMA